MPPSSRRSREHGVSRRHGDRPQKTRILIVCEGQTEERYFAAIGAESRYNNKILTALWGGLRTNPRQIVEIAKGHFEHNRREYDQIYCVFDGEEHVHFEEAVVLARRYNGVFKNDDGMPVVVKAIPSNPSFELWLLLHYQRVHHDAPIHRDDATRRLKEHIQAYRKGYAGIYRETKEHRQRAFEHSRLLECNTSGFKNPCTAVGKLVDLLLQES